MPETRVRRVAGTGRLRVGEQRAVGMIQAAGVGAISTMLSTPAEHRDAGLAEAVYQAVLQQLLIDGPEAPDGAPVATAVAFRAVAPVLDVLSDGERRLLTEWLDRVVGALSRDPGHAAAPAPALPAPGRPGGGAGSAPDAGHS